MRIPSFSRQYILAAAARHTSMKAALWLFFALLLSKIVQLSALATCSSWEGDILVCNKCAAYRGHLTLSRGEFTLNIDSSDPKTTTKVVWTDTGEVRRTRKLKFASVFFFWSLTPPSKLISIFPERQASLSDMLYLTFEFNGVGGCPKFEPASSATVARFTGLFPPNSLLWVLRSNDLLYLAAANSSYVFSLTVWNTTNEEWLESVIVGPDSATRCPPPLPFPPQTYPTPPVESPGAEPGEEPVSVPPVDTPQPNPVFTPTPAYIPAPTPYHNVAPIPAAPAKWPSSTPSFAGSVSPTTQPAPTGSPKVGLIVGLSVGLPFTFALLAAALTLVALKLPRPRFTEIGQAGTVHNNPLYAPQYSEGVNPLYKAPDA